MEKAMPIIGVIPLWDENKDSFWMLPGYMTGIMQAGGCPVILPLTGEDDTLRLLTTQFDGFLFTGGQDVSPALYGENPSAKCECPFEPRDTMEAELFSILLESNKPMFGICRGLQLFNVLLGGSLYQDIPSEYPCTVIHAQTPPYDIPAHRADIVRNTPLERLLRENSINVNSCHHQAIKLLSPRLDVMAKSEDGLVEAVYMPDKKFVWAVQWHPEFSLNDESSKLLFSTFVDACKS